MTTNLPSTNVTALNQSQFNRDVQINECLEEYIVKKGYSLDSWKKLSDQEKKDIKDKYKNQRVWRVVHGNKKGQIGKPINSYKNPDGSTKYTNYDKALSIHNAIVLNKENILSDGELIIEGKIKDIYIIAQNSKSYEEFVQIMKQEYPNLRLTKSILQKIYDDAKEMMQESFIKLISLIKPKKKS